MEVFCVFNLHYLVPESDILDNNVNWWIRNGKVPIYLDGMN